MAPVKGSRRRDALIFWLMIGALSACSPEAHRVRDGGPGADPGNRLYVNAPKADPKAADTTLWPGRAPAPVELLAAGQMPPPTLPAASAAAAARKGAPSAAEKRAFNKSAADPRKHRKP
jgi:hypothetical protein